ncbi:CPBP family intramembrane metalloprotease [Macrococcoides goetzii]|nr:CPBP family intramembrane metalloprotease [Macrococcus goetzii]
MDGVSKVNKLSKIIYILSFSIILFSCLYVQFITGGYIKISADHNHIIHFLLAWLPSIIGILLIFITPKLSNKFSTLIDTSTKSIKFFIFLSIALIILMIITPKSIVFNLFYIYKLLILLIIPMIFFYKENINILKSAKQQRLWLIPLLICIVWYITYIIVNFNTLNLHKYDIPYDYLIIGATISFILNAVLEELFYRSWLQTRLEPLLSFIPAIFITSILWALWHMGIQYHSNILLTFANVIVFHSITGIFLGLLWLKYRNIILNIFVHGLLNFPVYIVTYWFN